MEQSQSNDNYKNNNYDDDDDDEKQTTNIEHKRFHFLYENQKKN